MRSASCLWKVAMIRPKAPLPRSKDVSPLMLWPTKTTKRAITIYQFLFCFIWRKELRQILDIRKLLSAIDLTFYNILSSYHHKGISEAALAEGERRVGTSVRRSTTCGAMRVGLVSQTYFLILRDFFNMEPWGRRYGDRRRRRAQPSSF